MPSQQFPQSEKFNCVFQLIKHQHNKAFIFSFISFIPLFSASTHLPRVSCLSANPSLLSGLERLSCRGRTGLLIQTILVLILCLCFLCLGLFKAQLQVWSSLSWRRRENLMVVYSGASTMPSHLFQSAGRGRGTFCNLRGINPAYLFRLSLFWDHRPTLTFSHKHHFRLH